MVFDPASCLERVQHYISVASPDFTWIRRHDRARRIAAGELSWVSCASMLGVEADKADGVTGSLEEAGETILHGSSVPEFDVEANKPRTSYCT